MRARTPGSSPAALGTRLLPSRRWWRAPGSVWVRRVHLWAALSLGLLLLIVSTSGAALVMRPELDRLLHSSLYAASPGEAVVSLDAAIQVVREANPGAYIVSVNPPAPGERYLVSVDAPYRYVFVDPVSGTIVGALEVDAAVMGFLTRLHTTLFGNEIALPTGWLLSQVLLGGAAIMLLVMVITGAVLWWPGVRRFLANGLGLRVKRNTFATNRDLHKAIGVVSLLPLLMWAVTGADFEFREQTRALWYALTPGEPPAEMAEVASDPASGPGITADMAVQNALDAMPGARFSSLSPPFDETGAFNVWVSRGIDPYAYDEPPGESMVQVDRYSGEILQQAFVSYDSGAIEAYERWSYPLHSGLLAPWPLRLLWLGFGLTPLGLAITGVAWWLKRRGLRRAATPRSAEALSAPAPAD